MRFADRRKDFAALLKKTRDMVNIGCRILVLARLPCKRDPPLTASETACQAYLRRNQSLVSCDPSTTCAIAQVVFWPEAFGLWGTDLAFAPCMLVVNPDSLNSP